MLKRMKRTASKTRDRKARPGLSIIVVVYDMPTQAQNTLISLGTDYQQDVSMDDFEVIIVENESPNLMNQQFIESLPVNMLYSPSLAKKNGQLSLTRILISTLQMITTRNWMFLELM